MNNLPLSRGSALESRKTELQQIIAKNKKRDKIFLFFGVISLILLVVFFLLHRINDYRRHIWKCCKVYLG